MEQNLTKESDYEITVIYSSREDDFQVSKKKIENLFNKINIKVTSEKDLGTKELAYPILKNTHGHYYVYVIKASTQIVKTFVKEIKLIEKIIRHMVVHLDKKALRYFEKLEIKEKDKKKT